MNEILQKTNLQRALNPQMLNGLRSVMNNVNSPQMQTVMGMLNSSGMSAEQLVRQQCKHRGIDVNEFINTVKANFE